MRLRPSSRPVLAGAVLVPALAVAVAACGGSGGASPQADSSIATVTQGPTQTPTPTVTVSVTPPSSSATSAATTPPATSSSAAASSAASGRCATAGLKGSLGSGSGAAGSTYVTVLLRNDNAGACTLYGWPGVSFVGGSSGRQVGAAGTRNTGITPTTVHLAAGAVASLTLQVTDPYNFSNCGLTAVRGYRLYPPDSYTAIFIPTTGSQMACSSTAVHQITISPIAAGTQGSATS